MTTPRQSLLQYLSIALPAIPVQGTAPEWESTDPRYGAHEITHIEHWSEFNYTTIIQRHGDILNSKQIEPDPFRSPPAAIRDERHFRSRFAELLQPRVRRALRAAFEELEPHLEPHLEQQGLVPITFDGAGAAAYIDQFPSHTAFAFIALGDTYATSVNRAPGELKVSWKWRCDYQNSEDPILEEQYREVLSQVNFYMGQHGTRHGFVLTNTELLVIKRLDTYGHVAISSPISWSVGGPGQLTVLMGLWYVGMLAAEEANWSL